MSSSRGEELFQAAEKLKKKKTLFKKRQCSEETADKYRQSANAFKGERNFVRSGEAHMIAARLYLELGETRTAASEAVEAGACFSKQESTYEKAIEAYKFAGDVQRDLKKPEMAADGMCLSADLLFKLEKDDEAIDLLKEAIKVYQNNNNEPKAARHLEEIGEILADKLKYLEAADLFAQAAELRFKNSLTQSGAGMIFAKSILCILDTGDVIGARAKLNDYLKNVNPGFRVHFDCKFLLELMDKIEERDIEKFDEFIEKHKQSAVVDQWTNNRLLDLRRYADEEIELL